MTERVELGSRGFTVLDGVALVTGAAVASVHVRSAVPSTAGPIGWVWAWCLFGWLTLTSAGPYLFLVRKFFTRPEGYPQVGDRLWALSGLPWLVAAIVRTLEPNLRLMLSSRSQHDTYFACLSVGLGLVALISVPTLAARYLWNDPSSPRMPEPRSWTHRVGVLLAIAWPIQCGVALVLLD